jgi:hypothetical protein
MQRKTHLGRDKSRQYEVFKKVRGRDGELENGIGVVAECDN